MNNDDVIFADGFSFKRNENAPEFVVGKLALKVDEATAWLKTNSKNGWVNIDIKQSKAGNYYCQKDTWESKSNGATETPTKPTSKKEVVIEEDDLPF